MAKPQTGPGEDLYRKASKAEARPVGGFRSGRGNPSLPETNADNAPRAVLPSLSAVSEKLFEIGASSGLRNAPHSAGESRSQ